MSERRMTMKEFVDRILKGDTNFEGIHLPSHADLEKNIPKLNPFLQKMALQKNARALCMKNAHAPFLSAPLVFMNNLQAQNAKFKGAYLPRANLAGSNFKGCLFHEADFWGAHLTECNFTEADLRETEFGMVFLHKSIFKGANLCHSSFEGAHLMKADLREADVTGTDFEGANLMEADLRGIKNLHKAKNIEFAIYHRTKISRNQLSEITSRQEKVKRFMITNKSTGSANP